MLAVLVVISILSGAVAVGMAQMLEVPLWTSVLAYPLGGVFGLLIAASLLTLDYARIGRATRFAGVNAAAVRQPPRQ